MFLSGYVCGSWANLFVVYQYIPLLSAIETVGVNVNMFSSNYHSNYAELSQLCQDKDKCWCWLEIITIYCIPCVYGEEAENLLLLEKERSNYREAKMLLIQEKERGDIEEAEMLLLEKERSDYE